MKNNTLRVAIVVISLCTAFLLSCTTTRTYWDNNWNSWGRWEQTGSSESQRVSIT